MARTGRAGGGAGGVVTLAAWCSHISEVVNGGFPWERNSSVSVCDLSILCVVIYCHVFLRQTMMDSYNPLVVSD